MKKSIFAFFSLLAICTTSIAQQIKSPEGNFIMEFSLLKDGTPTYSLKYKNKEVIKPSTLGLELKNDKKSLLNDFVVVDSKT